ncbi:MAG: response regulator, partial [Ruminococcus sp.]|nr:response regulator [Ruminococcus sp.]
MKKFIETASLKRSVLIVEDEFINREILGSILSGEYEVAKASNGQEALDILGDNNNKISLVLLDLLMPVMDGFTFLSLVKSDPKLKRIPVIVMTSEKDAEVRSIRLGAADFITKPYDMP